MIKTRLHCFSKYPHIYVFIGKGEKTKGEIKKYLMQRLGLSEATARVQIEVALAEEHGIVLKENDKYRLSQRTVEYLIDYFMEFYKKDVCWMTREAYKRLVEAEHELKKLRNRLEMEGIKIDE